MNTFILLKNTSSIFSGKTAQKKQQSLLARQLLPIAASQLTGQPATHFSINESYPPQLLFRQQNSDLSVSISHRKTWVAVAVSHSRRLGLDLEVILPRDAAQLDLFLDEEEKIWLQTHLKSETLQTAFYLAWTAKEAAAKRHGQGWQSPDSELHLTQIKPGLVHLYPAPGLILAIASDEPLSCALQLAPDTAIGYPVCRQWPHASPSTLKEA